MTAPYAGHRGERVIVVFDENSMELDPSLPAPWWPNYGEDQDHYRRGDVVVYNHHFYRCRRDVTRTSNDFEKDPNRSAWIDITRGFPDVREQLPDAVGGSDTADTQVIQPNMRLYVDTRKGPVSVRLAPRDNWIDGDVIEIVDDYMSFNDSPCTLIGGDVKINSAEEDPNNNTGNLTLGVTGTQNIWRFIYYVNSNSVSDQWLYTDSAPGSGGGGAKPTIEEIEGPTTEPYKFGPNKIYVVKTTNGPVEMIPDGKFNDGDTFTIIDHDWTFGKMDDQGNTTNAAYLLPTDSIKYLDTDGDGKFILDVKGNSSAWPFIYYKGFIHCSAAPISRYWIEVITDLLDGSKPPAPDASDPTPATQDGALDDIADASLFTDTDPTMMIDDETDRAPEPEIPAIAPGTTYRLYSRLKVSADVDQADIWTQYDVTLGRRKSISVRLPRVETVPDQSRIRVRLISDSRGIVNVFPDADDQIVGLYGTLNFTPNGTPRALHGQYAMIELESDGDHEWMIV